MPTLITVATAVLTLIPLAGFAQDQATDVLKADIEAVLSSPDGGVDRQISVVDIGKLNVAVGVLHRGPTGDSAGSDDGHRAQPGHRGVLRGLRLRDADHRHRGG